ncbi:hypothetical protein [Paucibacter sp. Y2R2-4]|uniref:hypothetical protein n=1 Tax=Paucibacter sp. Y2R2-4 TaxID=2893553 RepID=UPI0021E4AE89|nr:hypothetical protein [Paucibacter sp. Y2R2-4]MCV2349346.1 hypothetical protein [Paucibacter sp. Y2R2-4]
MPPNKRYFHNDSDQPRIIGGVLVPAHDGREVDAQFHPDQEAESTGDGWPEQDLPLLEPDEESALLAAIEANLLDLLKGNVKSIVATLPESSDETLAHLLRLEQISDTPRKSLLAEITELQLQRAQAKTGAPE